MSSLKIRTRPRLAKLAAAPPEKVADGVWLIRGGFKRVMNVLLLEDGDGVVAYDAGEKGMAGPIAAAAQSMGGLKRVVLGHADTDHRGSAPQLSQIAPIQCHPDAVEQAQGSGGRDYWRMEELPLVVQKAHGYLHEHVWDGGPVQISGTVAEGDTVAGFEVVELSGHAPGLIGLWRERDRLALVSDTVYITDMYGRPIDPSVPDEPYNLDTEKAKASIRKLAALDPATVVPGHLGPLTGPGLREKLERAGAP
jgi:glyoxylase-like metal-dependent hydrolase (beta-lactamase superfamily II)